jgi:hypothetical protein
MEEFLKNIISFYSTLEWLNRRNNSDKNTLLGTSKLEYTPFISKINSCGINSVVKNISNDYVKILNVNRKP